MNTVHMTLKEIFMLCPVASHLKDTWSTADSLRHENSRQLFGIQGSSVRALWSLGNELVYWFSLLGGGSECIFSLFYKT